MRGTRVPSKVTRSTKLRGAQCSPELSLRSTDFRAPENLIFPALDFEMFHKIGALKTFAKLTGKLLRWSNFNVYKLIVWDPATFT